MKEFINKHKLSLMVIIFTIVIFFMFLYIDVFQIIFKVTKDSNGNFILMFLGKTWFFIIPILILITAIIILLVCYLKKSKYRFKYLIMILTIVLEIFYISFISMFFMIKGFCFYPKYYNEDIFDYKNIYNVEVNVGKNKYTSLYYDNNNEEVTILFLGNGQVSSDIFIALGEEGLSKGNRNLLIMDYPMFGNNDGKLVEAEIYKEVDELMNFLVDTEGYDYSNIRVCGYSIGTGVACYCASKYPNISSLVLFAPYDKFASAINNVTPVFYGPLCVCVRYKFDSLSRANNIKAHTTIIYSLTDEVIPPIATKNLINHLNNVNVVELDGSNHSEVFFNLNTKFYLIYNEITNIM